MHSTPALMLGGDALPREQQCTHTRLDFDVRETKMAIEKTTKQRVIAFLSQEDGNKIA